METRSLGPLKVPVVGLGTWQIFDQPGTAGPVLDAAESAGVRLVDSSPMYGPAEERLAEALQGRREHFQVATKLWTHDDAEAERQLAAQLAWFGHLDVLQVHNVVAWRARLDLIERERDAGRVLAVGATHHRVHELDLLEEVMRTGRLDMVQIPYNVRSREVEQRILPLAADLGLGVLIMRPFGEGVLLQRPPAAEALAPLGMTWAQALLRYVLDDPRVTCAIPASSKPARVLENAAAGELPSLTPEQRALVERLAG